MQLMMNLLKYNFIIFTRGKKSYDGLPTEKIVGPLEFNTIAKL